jgi:hypothetical protein
MSTGQVLVSVVASKKQRPKITDLPGLDRDHALPGRDQYPKPLTDPVRAWTGQQIGVRSQCLKGSAVGIDGVGLATATTVGFLRSRSFHDLYPSCCQDPGQADFITAGSFQRNKVASETPSLELASTPVHLRAFVCTSPAGTQQGTTLACDPPSITMPQLQCTPTRKRGQHQRLFRVN